MSWRPGLVGREVASLHKAPPQADGTLAWLIAPSPPSSALPPSLPLTLSRWDQPLQGKKPSQFVMSCPAVNLPLPSHREDSLSSIYLFATRTMEGPRPAELFIITPPTLPPPACLPQPAAPAEELQVSAGINQHGAPTRPWGGSR